VTPRPIPRSRLDHLIPALVESQALVALVPATGNLRWAAETAWAIARAATEPARRRVALIDLWIEDPTLHEVVGLTPTDGIVDAFEYGVSLTKTAHEFDGVFFIAAGSYTASAGDLLAHPRWPKLQAGFRSEGALLLLYLSPSGLARLSAVPDGVLVLAPDGFEPESSIGQGVSAALERGAPFLGVVRERWTPDPAAAPAIHPPRPRPLPRPGPRRRRRHGAVLLGGGMAVTAAAGWVLLASGGEPTGDRPASVQPPAVSAPLAPLDSLPWTIQIAAYSTLDRALAHVGELDEAFITPIVLGPGGTVWYRVLLGAYPSRDAAARERDELWRRGLVRHGEGELLHAPYMLLLRTPANTDSLRLLGLPGPLTDRERAIVGAFETPEQASFAQAQLRRAGVRAALVTRTGRGTTP